jgi:hypothetical protein
VRDKLLLNGGKSTIDNSSTVVAGNEAVGELVPVADISMSLDQIIYSPSPPTSGRTGHQVGRTGQGRAEAR